MHNRLKNIDSSAWAMFGVMLSFLLSFVFKLAEPFIWSCRIVILIILYRNLYRSFRTRSIDKIGLNLTVLFIGWLIIGFFRAASYSEGYWMWKSVASQLLISLFYIIIIVSVNTKIVNHYLKLYWLFCIPLGLLSQFSYGSIQQYNYMPFMVLAMCFPFLSLKIRWFLFAVICLYLLTFEHRNDMVKVAVAILIGLMLRYFYNRYSILIIKALRLILLTSPLVLLGFGMLNIFNPFKMDEYVKGSYTFTGSGGEIRDIKADTRTFIYENVFYTLNKYDDLIWGRSPAFGDEGGTFDDNLVTGLKGRYGNEVGVMDILLWYGAIGFLLYFAIFFRASYLAIYKSRNRLAKGIGLYTSCLWVMSFIWEKPLFETFFMTDLILIGLCFSVSFRRMTDRSVNIWVKSIFSERTFKNRRKSESTMVIKRSLS